ncbi:MAG TPA: glycosyltransferase family 4 protein [Kamptonema sp.]|nr:glycosyltransferase family 4 protein [Kamptonema sp.]
MNSMRVAIVTGNASMRMGGEASLPFYYFKLMLDRGIDVWMICHDRVREELREAFRDEHFQKIRFVEDTGLQIMIWRLSQGLPGRIRDLIFGQWLHSIAQRQAREVVKQAIAQQGIQIVFEPAPITPKGLSFMYDLGVPVVIGPLCGGLEFPPAFRYMDSRLSQVTIAAGRFLSAIAHQLVPGKLQAEALIAANKRTAEALPKGYKGKLYYVVESGVDLAIWKPIERSECDRDQPVRFVYSGRFVDWKGVKFLVSAFQQVAQQTNSILELIGDGELRGEIEAQVVALNIKDKVNFHGWMAREDSAAIVRAADVFVMPSLRECGGTALLEAMALGLPVVATNWAGPAEYVDSSCGILVEPSSPEEFANNLAAAMVRLAASPELRAQMGKAGTQRVTQHYFDWESKTDRAIEIFQEILVIANS